MYKNSEKLLYRFKYFLSPSDSNFNFLKRWDRISKVSLTLPDKLSTERHYGITVNLNPSQYDIEMSHAHFFRKEKSRLKRKVDRDRNKEYVQNLEK